jgi:hypothetical protein
MTILYLIVETILVMILAVLFGIYKNCKGLRHDNNIIISQNATIIKKINKLIKK